MLRMGGRWNTDLTTLMTVIRTSTGTNASCDEPADITLYDWLHSHFGTTWLTSPVSDGELVFRLLGPLDVVEVSEFYPDPIMALT